MADDVNGMAVLDDAQLMLMVYKQQRDSALDALAQAQVKMVRYEQRIAQLERLVAAKDNDPASDSAPVTTAHVGNGSMAAAAAT